MKSGIKGNLRLAATATVAGLFTACGGGGGGGGGFENGADASGIWSGTLIMDSVAEDLPAVLIVQEDGKFYLDNDYVLFIGNATTEETAITADAKGYTYLGTFPVGGPVEFTGTVDEQTTVNLAFSGSGDSGGVEFDYLPGLSSFPASLETIAGNYSGHIWLRSFDKNANITITADGDVHGDGGFGCTIDGSVSVFNATRNLYKWSVRTDGCPYDGKASGIGFLYSDEGDLAFYFVGLNSGAPAFFQGTQVAPAALAKPNNGAAMPPALPAKALAAIRSRMNPQTRTPR